MQDKKYFDLMFSIGGSCASASQLKNRGFRFTSLPFDWLTTFNPNDTFTLQKEIEIFMILAKQILYGHF